MIMNRRSLLRAASWGALGQLAGMSPLRSISALAQSTSPNDYKALICLFMRGGNDSNNMIVPLDAGQIAHYNAARQPLALSRAALLPMSGIGYGLHPAFVQLNQAFSGGQAAVIANVGPLAQPTSAADYRAGVTRLPQELMSHEGQQQVWETGGYLSGTGPGWAGLMADKVSASYNSSNLPMVTLLGSATNFGLGNQTAPYTVGPNAQQVSTWCSAGGSCSPRLTSAQQLLTFSSGVDLIQADEQLYTEMYKYNSFYNSILPSASPLKTPFPATSALAPALKTIATMIQLRHQIGARRQVFLINYGSFDTHAAQSNVQSTLYGQLDQAIGTFVSSMQELGLYDNVTLFTASDFARTLQSNGSLGTDHAWGGHHFAIGGAVKGGKLYGTFPSLELNGVDDIDGSGRWAPSTAVSQYMATLASWFGVATSELTAILPGLGNFSSHNLGFV